MEMNKFKPGDRIIVNYDRFRNGSRYHSGTIEKVEISLTKAICSCTITYILDDLNVHSLWDNRNQTFRADSSFCELNINNIIVPNDTTEEAYKAMVAINAWK